MIDDFKQNFTKASLMSHCDDFDFVTLIAGIYGMNFKLMPELEWQWGYPMALTVMAGVAVAMLMYFRKWECLQ